MRKIIGRTVEQHRHFKCRTLFWLGFSHLFVTPGGTCFIHFPTIIWLGEQDIPKQIWFTGPRNRFPNQ